VEEPFRPRALAGRVGRFEEIAGDLLDDALDGGRFDLVDAVAVPFPVTVIAELLGVPATDHDRFRRWSETLVTTPPTDADPETVRERRAETTEELTDYLGGHVEERRTDPRGDVLSTLAHAVSEGRLDDDEAVGTAMLLLVAGNVTTTNLIGNAIRCLAAHPAEAARFRDGEVPVEGLVEEVLRYRSPVQALSRVATRAVGVAGETIAPGDLVVPWLGAANRDPRRFDAPEDFRIDRAPNPHLGFGRGTHYCLGAPLARMETRIVLGELFDRVRSVSVATDDLEPVRSSFLHGIESLPVTVDPR
jgi:cytochrome P450